MATFTSNADGRYGSATAPRRRWTLLRLSATAVVQSSAPSMPMEDPPKRGLTMYGPGQAGPGRSAPTVTLGNDGRPAATPLAPQAILSIPRAAPARDGPLYGP